MANYKTGRVMMNRGDENVMRIIKDLPPGTSDYGCLGCIETPACCACCVCLPCCILPKYIDEVIEDSKYVHLRETAIEWNSPVSIFSEGGPCGINCCGYRVQDNVHVVYYDDPILNEITDQTRCCNDNRTHCCGGEGDEIQLRHTFCLGCCVKALPPFLCVPICCPRSLCPCAVSHTLYVRIGTAPEALRQLVKARDQARSQAAKIEGQINQQTLA